MPHEGTVGRRYYISVGLWAQMALLHLKQIDLAVATGTSRQYVAKRYGNPRMTVSETFAERASAAFGLPMDEYFLPAPGLAERRVRARAEVLVA